MNGRVGEGVEVVEDEDNGRGEAGDNVVDENADDAPDLLFGGGEGSDEGVEVGAEAGFELA